MGFEVYFDKNDWDHFHDVVFDITYNSTKTNLTQEQMKSLFCELPEELRFEAYEYGMNDTCWRDSFGDWYLKNKM